MLCCFSAVFQAERTPRCLLEPCVAGVPSFSGLSAAVAPAAGEPRPAASSLPAGISWELGSQQEHSPAPAPIYVLACGLGRIPLVPAPGVVAAVVAVVHPCCPVSRQGDVQPAPALCCCLSPWVLRATLPTLQPHRCTAAVPLAGEWQPQPAVICKAGMQAAP